MPGTGRPRLDWRAVLPRPVAVACLLILLAEAILLLALRPGADRAPRDLPVAISTAPVVAQALVAQANELPERPFAAEVVADEDDARQGVRDGSLAAVLIVDLATTTDVLVLNRASGPDLNRAIEERVEVLAGTHQRTIAVERIDTTHASRGAVDLLSLLGHVMAFGFVVALTIRWGPVSRTTGRAVLRHLGILGMAVLASGVLVLSPLVGPDAPRLATFGVLVLLLFVAGSTTLALEAVAGLSGLALAVVLFLAQATPLLIRSDLGFLPAPWPQLLGLTPVGAADGLLTGLLLHDAGPSLARPLLVHLAWLAVAILTFVVAFRARRAAGHIGSEDGDPGAVLWRWRVAAVVGPAIAVLLVLALVLPHGVLTEAQELPSRASETACVETGPVRDVDDLNRITEELRGGEEAQSSFQGGDVGASVQLQDGRTILVFGDTLRDPGPDGRRLVRNSMLVVEPGCLQVVTPADHGAVIPDRDDEVPGGNVGYWPMSLGRESRPGYDLVVVATQRIRAHGPEQFDFEVLGPSMAVFVVHRGGVPQLIDQVDIGEDDSDPGRPMWGAASAIDDGWVYLYGTAHPDDGVAFGYSLSVARTRTDDVLDRSTWRFWDGTEWVEDETEAAELIPAVRGVSQTLSVFEQDGTWYALSKRDDFLGTDLVVWTAPSPTGPFTDHEPLAQLPTDTVTGEMRYMPLAHPGLLPEEGTMVVSYSRNRTDIDEVIEDPMRYRPRFLRVALPH